MQLIYNSHAFLPNGSDMAYSSTLIMEAWGSSEMSVNFYKAAQSLNSEDSCLHHYDNLKSHSIVILMNQFQKLLTRM